MSPAVAAAAGALDAIEEAVRTCQAAALPEISGRCAKIQALILLRFAPGPAEREQPTSDRVLTVDDVAKALGRSRRWVYAHRKDLGFRLALPGKRLAFSEAGLLRYVRRRGLTG